MKNLLITDGKGSRLYEYLCGLSVILGVFFVVSASDTFQYCFFAVSFDKIGCISE